MRKIILIFFLFSLTLNLFAQNYGSKVKMKNLVSTVDVLTSDEMGGRLAGSGYDLKVATYLEKELLKLGYRPLIGKSGILPFDCGDGKESYNVVMAIGDCGDNLLVGAHHDHLGIAERDDLSEDIKKGDIFRGANDNASGVATLMEAARIVSMNKRNLKHTIIITAFGMEEGGIIGSEKLMKQFKENEIKINFMINFEMTGSMNSDNLVEVLGADTFDMRHYFERLNNYDHLRFLTYRALRHFSDHVHFYGIAPITVFATTDVKNYHHPKDTKELLNFDGLKKLTSFAVNFVMLLAQEDVLPKMEKL